MFDVVYKKLLFGDGQSGPWRISRWWLAEGPATVELPLLRLMALAHRERLELAPLISNLAYEYRRWTRRRFKRLARRIEEGLPPIDALEQTPYLLSEESLLSLRFATQTGTLSQAYEELVERAATRSQASAYQVRQAIEYGACLSVVSFLVISFLMAFIARTFTEMFAEFGLELPSALQTLMWLSDQLTQNLPVILIGGVMALGLLWFAPRIRSHRRRLFGRFAGASYQQPASQLLRMLAQSLEAGRPLPGVLSTLARHHFDRGMRLKLLIARNEIEQGAETWGTLVDGQLLSAAEADALANASSNSLRTWMMRRLAQKKEEGLQYRSAAWAMLVHPAIVLFFGGLVLWVSYAFFSVLVVMISSLA